MTFVTHPIITCRYPDKINKGQRKTLVFIEDLPGYLSMIDQRLSRGKS